MQRLSRRLWEGGGLLPAAASLFCLGSVQNGRMEVLGGERKARHCSIVFTAPEEGKGRERVVDGGEGEETYGYCVVLVFCLGSAEAA